MSPYRPDLDGGDDRDRRDPAARRRVVERAGGGGSSGLADVVELILDKGLVIDVFVRVSLVGIEILTIDARIVVASVDTFLRFAEATNRLDLYGRARAARTSRSSCRASPRAGPRARPPGCSSRGRQGRGHARQRARGARGGAAPRRQRPRQRPRGARRGMTAHLRLRPGRGRTSSSPTTWRGSALRAGVDDRARQVAAIVSDVPVTGRSARGTI